MCGFDTFTYGSITILVLANTSITSHNYHFFFVVEIIKILSLSKFDVDSTVLLSNHYIVH